MKATTSDVRLYKEGETIARKVIRMNGQMGLETAHKIAAKNHGFDRAVLTHYTSTRGGDAVIMDKVIL